MSWEIDLMNKFKDRFHPSHELGTTYDLDREGMRPAIGCIHCGSAIGNGKAHELTSGAPSRRCIFADEKEYPPDRKAMLVSAIRSLDSVQHQILDIAGVHFLDGCVQGSGLVWDCPDNKTGVCVYPITYPQDHRRVDWDSCLFCGQPLERK